MLASCSDGGDHEDLRLWMNEAAKDVKGKIPPLPQVKPYEPVAYDAGNLIDPFKPAKIAPEKKEQWRWGSAGFRSAERTTGSLSA